MLCFEVSTILCKTNYQQSCNFYNNYMRSCKILIKLPQKNCTTQIKEGEVVVRSKPLCNLRKSQSLGFCLLHLQLVFVKMTLEIDISPYQHVHIYRTEWHMKHVSNQEVQFTKFKVSCMRHQNNQVLSFPPIC